MKKNPIWYLGLIGFLGLLGIVTGNTGLFGLFGFFGFFGMARQTDDEMLRHNMAKAGLSAFIVSLVGFPVATIILSFLDSSETVISFFVIYFSLLFVAQILTFVFSFNYYEKRGDLS
ncbi:MAG: DUF3796 domain-containing protein [Bacillota bacterium]|nr:DUF3796 domain-containing protein [Bacillota bacterium]